MFRQQRAADGKWSDSRSEPSWEGEKNVVTKTIINYKLNARRYFMMMPQQQHKLHFKVWREGEDSSLPAWLPKPHTYRSGDDSWKQFLSQRKHRVARLFRVPTVRIRRSSLRLVRFCDIVMRMFETRKCFHLHVYYFTFRIFQQFFIAPRLVGPLRTHSAAGASIHSETHIQI